MVWAEVWAWAWEVDTTPMDSRRSQRQGSQQLFLYICMTHILTLLFNINNSRRSTISMRVLGSHNLRRGLRHIPQI